MCSIRSNQNALHHVIVLSRLVALTDIAIIAVIVSGRYVVLGTAILWFMFFYMQLRLCLIFRISNS